MEALDEMEYKVLYLLMAGYRNEDYIARILNIDTEFLDECINNLIEAGLYCPETIH
jgi:ABC-type enterochelin transport system ATPase subunit